MFFTPCLTGFFVRFVALTGMPDSRIDFERYYRLIPNTATDLGRTFFTYVRMLAAPLFTQVLIGFRIYSNRSNEEKGNRQKAHAKNKRSSHLSTPFLKTGTRQSTRLRCLLNLRASPLYHLSTGLHPTFDKIYQSSWQDYFIPEMEETCQPTDVRRRNSMARNMRLEVDPFVKTVFLKN